MPEKNEKNPAKKRNWKKTVLFLLIPLVVIIFILEIVFRISGTGGTALDPSVYKNVPGDLTPRQDLIHTEPHTGISYQIVINEQGFRGKGKITGRPCKILCLGDSSMLGYGVDEGYTAPDLWRKWTEIEWPGIFDVLNAGSIGYTIDDELAYMKEKGVKILPDAVYLEIFYNDVNEKVWREQTGSGTQREFRKKALPYTFLRSLFLKSAFYQGVRYGLIMAMVKAGKWFPANRMDMMEVAMYPSKHKEAWDEYDRKLEEFIDFLRGKNIPLVVIITPHQYQVHKWAYPEADYYGVREFQDHILEILEKKDVPAVDLMPVFREEMKKIPSLYLTGGMYDEHLNGTGQYVKAREAYPVMMNVLEKNGFYNFYNEYDNAEKSGETHLGRKWISHDDSRCLVTRDDAEITFNGISAGRNPEIVFANHYRGDNPESAILEITVRTMFPDETGRHLIRTFEYKPPPEARIFLPLEDFAEKKISVKWGVRKSEKAGKEKQKSGNLFIMSPMMIDDKISE